MLAAELQATDLAIRLTGQGNVEIQPIRDVLEDKIVQVAIFKDRREAAGGLFVYIAIRDSRARLAFASR